MDGPIDKCLMKCLTCINIQHRHMEYPGLKEETGYTIDMVVELKNNILEKLFRINFRHVRRF